MITGDGARMFPDSTPDYTMEPDGVFQPALAVGKWRDADGKIYWRAFKVDNGVFQGYVSELYYPGDSEP